jgi:hypothetical protein
LRFLQLTVKRVANIRFESRNQPFKFVSIKKQTMKKGPMLISNLAVLFTSKKYEASTQREMRPKCGITSQLISVAKVKVEVGCIAIISLLLTGCYQQFYATGTKEPPVARDLVNVRDWKKEIILHFEDSIVHLQQMTLSHDTLAGLAAVLPMELSKQLKPKRKRSTGYQARQDPTVTNQAHIYAMGRLSGYIQTGDSMVQIPHAKIQRMDVYERDGTAIAVNYTLSTLGIIICIALPVLLLVASFFG